MRLNLFFLAGLTLLLFSCTPTYIVTFSAGNGGSVSTIGGEYDEGTVVSVSANPDAEYKFVSWSDGSTQNPRSITVSETINLTATFTKKQYDVTTNVIGKGTIKEEVLVQGGRYNSGSQIKLTAVPEEGWEFTAWSGDVASTENPVTVNITEAKEVTATFTRKKFDLNVTVVGEGTVTEEVVIQGGRYNSGSQIKLTATAAEGWMFSDWNGAIDSNENPITLSLNEDSEVTATFLLEDTDGDGVPDSIDIDNSTREGVPVDEDGVMLNPIYLDDNGVTIKSYEWGIAGDIGFINGIEYLIVNEEMLREMVTKMQNPTRVVTSKITNMNMLFASTDFNEDINNWDTSSVVEMKGIFLSNTEFNFPLDKWDVSNVKDMSFMFASAFNFNQDISGWDVSNVETMASMFRAAYNFNQDISDWDVSSVTRMNAMFQITRNFNQPLDTWNVSNVLYMSSMFGAAEEFNQDLSNWDVNSVIGCDNFRLGAKKWTLPKPNFTNCEEF